LALDKVTAYITRSAEDGTLELLVFQHPEAGIQLPAGTGEQGETLESSVLREAWEETGLNCLWLVGHLASEQQVLPDGSCMLESTVRVLQEPSPFSDSVTVPMGGGLFVERMLRGATCRQLETTEAGDYSRVAFDLFEVSDGHSTLLSETIGWVPTAALTTEIMRHHFHLTTTTSTADTWTHDADVPGCQLFWLPLKSASERLVEPQNSWLVSVMARLEASASLPDPEQAQD
jgi:NUDIX domain